MGKFDGYLICTDYDGTFATKTEPVAENIPAVRYFTENGGRFTVATGRSVDFLREKGVHNLINAPACLYNGSVVYDYGQEKLLRVRHLPFSVENFLRTVGDSLQHLELLHVFGDDFTEAYGDVSVIPPNILASKPLKLLCRYPTAEAADAFKAAAGERFSPAECFLSKSWSLGVEMNPPDGTKEHALDFIKSCVPDIHTVVGVGDNDNDWIMLIRADIGAAPENAADTLKTAADLHLCPCTEGAIADLIRQLEKMV